MNETTKTAIEIYGDFLAGLQKCNQNDPRVKEEIARVSKHIHNLETDHRDCVTPCCMGCKLGGAK
jgi:hypothetical protein